MNTSYHTSNQNDCFDAQDAQNLQLRLQRQLQLYQQAQFDHKLQKGQLQYRLKVLQQVQQQRKNIQKSIMNAKSFGMGGWQSQLKQLTDQANNFKCEPVQQINKQKTKATDKGDQLGQGKLLEYILDLKKVKNEQEQISKLQEKLQNLYSRIGKKLQDEMMSDKILQRIKKEAKRASKVNLLPIVQKEIKTYSSWQQNQQQQLNNNTVQKEVEQKIVQNLQLMKLIVTKKVNNNDYIYEQLAQQNIGIRTKAAKIESQADLVMQAYEANTKELRNYMINQRNQYKLKQFSDKRTKKVASRSLNVQKISEYFEEVESILEDYRRYQHQEALLEQSERINKQLK